MVDHSMYFRTHLLLWTLFSVSLHRFFFFFFPVRSLFLNTIFPFGLFSFIPTADPAGHVLGSIYILSLSLEFILEKGFQKLFTYILFFNVS